MVTRTVHPELSHLLHADHLLHREAFAWLTRALADPGRRAMVLDVGCHDGQPADRLLIDAGIDVVGVDPSPVTVDEARHNVPDAIYVERDLFDLDGLHPAGVRFDAVISLFALQALPRADTPPVLDAMRRQLHPGGLLLLSVPEGEDDPRPDLLLGRPVTHTRHAREGLRGVLRDAGFEVLDMLAEYHPDHVDLHFCGRAT